jgi:hypothetical protein
MTLSLFFLTLQEMRNSYLQKAELLTMQAATRNKARNIKVAKTAKKKLDKGMEEWQQQRLDLVDLCQGKCLWFYLLTVKNGRFGNRF